MVRDNVKTMITPSVCLTQYSEYISNAWKAHHFTMLSYHDNGVFLYVPNKMSNVAHLGSSRCNRATTSSLLRHVLVGVLFFANAVHHFVGGAHGDAGDRLHVSRHGRAVEYSLAVMLSHERGERDQTQAAGQIT